MLIACLLIINISEASKVQNHVKAYAAALLYPPAITHCPPKCIMHHTLHTLIAICVHSALSKHNPVATRQEHITVLHCWMLLHAIKYSLHTTLLPTCASYTCCPALRLYTRHHLPFLGGPCFATTAPGERWSCMHWWHVSMQPPYVVHASSCCKLSCMSTCWSHGKGFCSLNCHSSMD